MILEFYNLIQPLNEYKTGTETWGDLIIEEVCRGVYLKPESLIEEITSIIYYDTNNVTKKIQSVQGKTRIVLPYAQNEVIYLTNTKQFFRYSYSTIDSENLYEVTLRDTTSKLNPYEKRSGRYKYDLRYLQELIYNANNVVGVKKVGQNYFRIQPDKPADDHTYSPDNRYISENDEYFYYSRYHDNYPKIKSIPTTGNLGNLSEIWSEESSFSEEQKEAYTVLVLEEDTTLMAAYAALKRAVAMAEFYCTCLPMLSTKIGHTDDFTFIRFFRYAQSKSQQKRTCFNLEDYLNEIDVSSYTAPYYIDPQTHVIRLGHSDDIEDDYIPANPITYYEIRRIYQECSFISVARPGYQDDGTDLPTDTHFQQIIQKVNSSFDFSIPIEIWETEEESTSKFYKFNKITGFWEEVPEEQIPEIKQANEEENSDPTDNQPQEFIEEIIGGI